ncbi:MAG: hypothetical protein ACRDA5_00445 [Clostridium sp.]
MDRVEGIYNYSINKYDLANTFIYQVSKNKKLKICCNLLIISVCILTSSFIEAILRIFVGKINVCESILFSAIIIVVSYITINRNFKRIVASIYSKDVKKNPQNYEVLVIIYANNIKYTFGKEVYDFSINDRISLVERSEAIYIENNKNIICIPNRVIFSQEDKKKLSNKN